MGTARFDTEEPEDIADWLAAAEAWDGTVTYHKLGESTGDLNRDALRQAALARRVAVHYLVESLKGLRAATGFTQKEVAEHWGRPQSNVSRVESRPEDVRVGTLINYLAALGGHLAVEAIVDGETIRVELA